MSLYRVRGFVRGVNWRARKFAAPVPPHLTCRRCHVIPRTTFLLPCLHTLCESCVIHSVSDGDRVYPFDDEPFAVGDCQKIHLPVAASEKLKACCWNETHGCTFVGTLQAVLTHYEEEFIFHAVTCTRCNGPVLHQHLPRHYRAECCGEAIAAATRDATLCQGMEVSVDGMRSSIDALKALPRNPYQDRFPAQQRTINGLLEMATKIDSVIGAINRYCTESEHRITQAIGQLSATFAEQLESQQSALSASLKENFRIKEILEQVLNHGMRVDEITKILSDSKRSLSDQLVEATHKLAPTFRHELQSQQAILVPDLKKHLDTKEISEQVNNHGMRIDAIAKELHDSELRLSHQLAEAVEELSKTFAKKVESQQRQLCAQLKQMSGLQ